jgi:hypothetical protein
LVSIPGGIAGNGNGKGLSIPIPEAVPGSRWRYHLPKLAGLPLVPIGAGPKGKGKTPIDPKNGQAMEDWQNVAFTPEQISKMPVRVIAVGTRCGPDAGGLVVFDIDGPTAMARARAAGCDPAAAATWRIGRNTSSDRIKVAFRAKESDWPWIAEAFGTRGTARLATYKPTAEEKAQKVEQEQLELFWSTGQVIVAGRHLSSDGHYDWDGTSPKDLAELPEAWANLAREILAGNAPAKAPPPPRPRPQVSRSSGGRGLAVPLDEFISRDHRDLIKAGSARGGNNEDGMALALDLVGTEQWLLDKCATPELSAETLFRRYVDQSAVNYGPDFDHGAAMVRFEGAAAFNPTPSTPEDQLEKRLAFHTKKADQRPAAGRVDPDILVSEGRPGKATKATVEAGLRQAIADELDDDELAHVVAELAKASGLTTVEVDLLYDGLLAEDDRAAKVASDLANEAARLQAKAAHRRIGEAITLSYLFPAPIAEALEARTRYLPADAAAIAILFLASVASLLRIGSRITGNSLSGFVEPLLIWTSIVANSGKKKSPLLTKVVDEPTETIRAELRDAYDMERQLWEEAQKTRKQDDPKLDPPRRSYLRVNDTTLEALSELMAHLYEQGRGLLLYRDELSGLFSGMNQYKSGKGNDSQALLEMWKPAPSTSLRMGAGTRHVESHLLSISGATQPAVLIALVNDSGGDPTGLFARFIFGPLTHPPVALPTRIDPEEQKEIDRALLYLQHVMESTYNSPVARHLHLDAGAVDMFSKYEKTRQDAADAAKFPAQQAVLGKSAAKTLRLTGILHLLDEAASGTRTDTVTAIPLMRAIDLVDYLDTWVLGLHAEIAQGDEPSGLMVKLQAVALDMGKPLTWRRFRDRLTTRQKKDWQKADFEQAAQQLMALGAGELTRAQQGTASYLATGELP